MLKRESKQPRASSGKSQSVLIIGGTGTIGTALADLLLDKAYTVILMARNEHKMHLAMRRYEKYGSKVMYVIGDIRNGIPLLAAPDYVVNCAAMKHVKHCADNPHEAYSINVEGNQRVIEYCLSHNVKKAVYVGTDKAVNPINFYGWTKKIAEEDWLAANVKKPESFCVIKCGNVFASSGSVVEIFVNQHASGRTVFKVADKKSERFFMRGETAAKMIHRFLTTNNGHVHMHPTEIKKMRIVDLVRAINPEASFYFVGLAEGEKLCEEFDVPMTNEYYTITEIREMLEEYKAGR